MIVTRGLGRAVVLGALVAFGLGVDPGAAAAATYSGGNARIGAEVLRDDLERVGGGLLDFDVRVGVVLAGEAPGRVGGAGLADLPERIGANELASAGRVGNDVLADEDERVGAEELSQRARIGNARLKRRT